jgi:hypothetical protein
MAACDPRRSARGNPDVIISRRSLLPYRGGFAPIPGRSDERHPCSEAAIRGRGDKRLAWVDLRQSVNGVAESYIGH